ncbi:YheC/YheD family protein [Bacillus sp. FJAT-29937]|uniref:YheC/YheD family protein n=1 Tax=Bacillus sp. FJAT-29937 TaxID=1720553 RepID=UPI000834D39B|nr:YheC/YheD family protein [Bacillus sp. FJAT-29937]
MKLSKSRISQYRILNADESFSKYLLDTELFTEASLFAFLEKYKRIVIKPSFGYGEIFVSLENNNFKVLSGMNKATWVNKEELYEYIIRNELKHKHHIIQPSKQNSGFFQSPFHYYVTVHRKSPTAEWLYMSTTEKNSTLFKKYFYMFFFNKMRKISILAAKKLGESFPDCHTIVIDIMYDLKGQILVQDIMLHFQKSKWSQFQTLSTNHSITPSVPKTDLLTKVTFKEYLYKYVGIIIKPCVGQQGKGIVKITMLDPFNYEIHFNNRKVTKTNMDEAYDYIKEKYLLKKSYIVQERIPLAEIDGCPIDIRVIAQKEDSSWKVTAKIVKVAGNGFFITNAAQKLLNLNQALQSSNLSMTNSEQLEYEIDKICISASKLFEESRPDIHIIGFDIGISHKGDIWIIEGNFKPDLSMFMGLEDKDMYMYIRKIIKSQTKPTD